MNTPFSTGPESLGPLNDPGISFGTGMGGGAGSHDHPGICGFGLGAIESARNPTVTYVQMTQIRGQLACPGCISAFDLELKVKLTLATAVREQPPDGLQIRISAALERIDLSGIDVTDL